MNRIFVDLDGVIVDFDAYMKAHMMSAFEIKKTPGAYLMMPAIPGSLAAVRELIAIGFEVWIATKPPTGVPHAYSDKAAWVMRELPELTRRIIVTHDKGMLGDARDYMCDDRPHKANCERFAGKLLRFVDGYHWPQALEYFRRLKRGMDTRRIRAPEPAVFSPGQVVRPLADCYEPTDDHSPGGYLGRKGDKIVVKEVKDTAYSYSVAVHHEGVTDGSAFMVSPTEIEPWIDVVKAESIQRIAMDPAAEDCIRLDQAEIERLRSILRELVRVDDAKNRLRTLHDMGHGTDYDEHRKRTQAAWDAARKTLAFGTFNPEFDDE